MTRDRTRGGPAGAPALRRATLDDRGAICALHVASIRRLCREAYAPEEIARWTGALRPESYTDSIDGREFHVAEEGGRLAGFCAFDPATAELLALYVHPDRAGRGVGSALLSLFEGAAASRGATALRLSATLNAVPFYERHGYLVTGLARHDHPSGVRLACARMVKEVAPSA